MERKTQANVAIVLSTTAADNNKNKADAISKFFRDSLIRLFVICNLQNQHIGIICELQITTKRITNQLNNIFMNKIKQLLSDFHIVDFYIIRFRTRCFYSFNEFIDAF